MEILSHYKWRSLSVLHRAYKARRSGYDVHVELGDKKILGEAKSGNALNLDAWNSKIKSQLGQQRADAVANGYEFHLFSNTKVPNYVRTWCESKGIPIVETLL